MTTSISILAVSMRLLLRSEYIDKPCACPNSFPLISKEFPKFVVYTNHVGHLVGVDDRNCIQLPMNSSHNHYIAAAGAQHRVVYSIDDYSDPVT